MGRWYGKRCGKMLAWNRPVIRFRCVTDKYANFTRNKIYTAEARLSNKATATYTEYRIKDDEGDAYIIHEEDLGRMFLLIPE